MGSGGSGCVWVGGSVGVGRLRSVAGSVRVGVGRGWCRSGLWRSGVVSVGAVTVRGGVGRAARRAGARSVRVSRPDAAVGGGWVRRRRAGWGAGSSDGVGATRGPAGAVGRSGCPAAGARRARSRGARVAVGLRPAGAAWVGRCAAGAGAVQRGAALGPRRLGSAAWAGALSHAVGGAPPRRARAWVQGRRLESSVAGGGAVRRGVGRARASRAGGLRPTRRWTRRRSAGAHTAPRPSVGVRQGGASV